MRLALLLALLLPGCQFLFEPTPEPRYRWVSYAQGGGFWQEHKSGRYYWNGTEFRHVVSRADTDRMSKRWGSQ